MGEVELRVDGVFVVSRHRDAVAAPVRASRGGFVLSRRFRDMTHAGASPSRRYCCMPASRISRPCFCSATRRSSSRHGPRCLLWWRSTARRDAPAGHARGRQQRPQHGPRLGVEVEVELDVTMSVPHRATSRTSTRPRTTRPSRPPASRTACGNDSNRPN